ncbi:MAG: sulfite exporter TauE/SafE family protein [Armatimonadetes bacterium]|nr:sulfite exporter TauE/SafE family protein [Armatimonadota bacterium]
MLTVLGLLVCGLMAGLLGAMLGLGGGIFLVPALTLLFHLDLRVAAGTSLVCVIATSAGVAAIAGRGRGPDHTLALRLLVATIAGAIAGGLVAGSLDRRVLSLLFATVVFATAAYTVKRSRSQARGFAERLFHRDYVPTNWRAGLGLSALAGLISGLLGVGGGFLQVPMMYAVMGVPLGIATATSNYMIGITASASVFIYYGRGDIRPIVVVPAAVGVFAGAMVGAYLLPRLRAQWLRTVLVGLMIVMGLQMAWQGVRP